MIPIQFTKIGNEKEILRQIRIFETFVIEYGFKNTEKIKPHLKLLKKYKICKEKPVIYLKINREEDYTYKCLQHWINCVTNAGYDYFILCDNRRLKHKVLKKVIFPNDNIKFIKSCKNRELKNFVNKIYTKWWKNATFAHLTTFYHAKKNNIPEFWNIDADDTMFMLEPADIGKLMQDVENYSKANNIKTISLDMWHSRTRTKHWSFGVTYSNNFTELFKELKELKNSKWQNYYKDYGIAFNLDWYFTYLKDKQNYNIQTFYVENCYFIHWGNFFINPIGAHISHWENETLSFPILKLFYKDNFLGEIPIGKNCIKFETDTINSIRFDEFAEKYISTLKYFPPEEKRLHNMKID